MKTFAVTLLILSAVVLTFGNNVEFITFQNITNPAPNDATDPASRLANTVSGIFQLSSVLASPLQNAIYNTVNNLGIGLGLGGLVTPLIVGITSVFNVIYTFVRTTTNNFDAFLYRVLQLVFGLLGFQSPS